MVGGDKVFRALMAWGQHSTDAAPQTPTHTVKEGLGDLQQDIYKPMDNVVLGVLERHKACMENKYESISEGIETQETTTLLNRIYTQLYIIEGASEGVNEEHEVLQMERTQRKHLEDTPINCSDIFKPLPTPEGETEEENIRNVLAEAPENKETMKGRNESKGSTVRKLRTVLTKGIAGIGKTVSVQKFILDWAEGKANQDVELMFVLPFRELNLIKDDPYSLHGLLCDLHPEIKDLDPKMYDQIKAVFIFDGLDESRIPLDFEECEKVSDITMTSSVGVLMTNLIKGELLPSALIWITSRPAAANQIPPKHINRVTEIQGFSDPQKEEYFRRRISDEDQAERIISHIKRVRSLHIMCHIPVFCWISATVLQQIMKQGSTEIPRTLTEMYSLFLLTQTHMKNEKYEEEDETDPKNLLESNRTVLLKLAELAFKQLMKGNVMFYEEDLRESRIDATEASVYSGIFTEIFCEESVLHQRKVYCFIHLSFQEFLAAVYVFHCYESRNMEDLQGFKPQHREWSENVTLDELLEGAVDKAVENKNGNLDCFLRFLLGISLESNQRLLQGLLTNTHSGSEKTAEYIRMLIRDEYNDISTESSINLFLCLSEMNDLSLSREIQEYLRSEKHSEKKLSPGQCSALTYMLLNSEDVLDELNLNKYNTSEEGYKRLIPAVSICKKAILVNCYFIKDAYEILYSALQSANSTLKELDLSNSDLQDSGVDLLCDGVRSCKLEILRLAGCNLTPNTCEKFASALQSANSSLKLLDLSKNDLQDSGVGLLSAGMKSSYCKLEVLRLYVYSGTSAKTFFHWVEYGGKIRMNPGLKKYACDLTLDPDTAHRCLSLSEGNRKVENMKVEQPYADHSGRFEHHPQVLCRESLVGRCYWEVQWSVEADVTVTYGGIERKGRSEDGAFGQNRQSWSLYCSDFGYSVWHNCKKSVVRAPRSRSHRVGVYVDWPAGMLSFYSVSPQTQTLTHLYTFTTPFTEPLYAGFGVDSSSSVKKRAGSPVPSRVPKKRCRSSSEPIIFSSEEEASDSGLQTQRPDSPRLSSLSMKSGQSMGIPFNFSRGGAEPSTLSMKSDQSMGIPFNFSRGGAEPSTLSMKSDQSMGIPFNFSSGVVPSDTDKCSTEETLQAPTPTLVTGTGDLPRDPRQPVEDVLQGVLQRHKTSMKNKFENLFEGIKTERNKTLIHSIYIQLYIIEGESEGVNTEHEVLQVRETSRRHLQDTPINCVDIFKTVKGETKEENLRNVVTEGLKHKEPTKGSTVRKLRTVLTKGIAGIGKTVSVQKFILDWAEGKANQDVEFMFVLPFRELNLIKDDPYSLHELLCDLHPEIKDLDPKMYDQIKAVFIFDGLDESRIPLDFEECEKVSDITMTSSVGVLMTNLIRGELLPSALIWITSRPAAANQIPPKHINRVTEIQGFSDPQKEEYFRRRISDEDQAQRIISHIKTVRSLHIMCHIPVFCWISATVLQQIMKQGSTEIPRTLTEMYSHFLLTQTHLKNEKYEEEDETDPKNLLESNRTVLLKLAELAFKQLMKGNVMFYEEDLRESRIDVTEASVYSGIFTEIFCEESVLHQRKVYCFIHLSFQEFLAAVYVFHCYESRNMEDLQGFKPQHREWSENVTLDELLEGAVDKALDTGNGHLDLFLRFLLGVSLESNQRLLQGLLTQPQSKSGDLSRTVQYIQEQIQKRDLPINRSINLFFCLTEMNDRSLCREIKHLKSKKIRLSPGQCSALACILLISEEALDDLGLKKYNTSEEGYKRLIPVLSISRKAILAGCNLTKDTCETLSSVLQTPNSFLKELDLSNNDLQDSGVELLCVGLRSSHCKLVTLRLENGDACDLTLDPKTAHRRLALSEGNRKVANAGEDHPYPDHPDRFEHHPQVLSVESLTGRCYWEAEWSGDRVIISVSYRGINRKGDSDSLFGNDDESWSLESCNNSYSVCHNNIRTALPDPPCRSSTVGVYVDYEAGTLSFYSVSPDTQTLTHMHTFNTELTEPLYAGLWVVLGRKALSGKQHAHIVARQQLEATEKISRTRYINIKKQAERRRVPVPCDQQGYRSSLRDLRVDLSDQSESSGRSWDGTLGETTHTILREF
ncbi:hypothetical protein NFI96_003650, partial [Prochilodus magdalenae]